MRSAATALVLGALLAAACGAGSEPPPPAASVEAIPSVDLSTAEASVQESLAEREQVLRELLESGAGGDELARAWGALAAGHLSQGLGEAAADCYAAAEALQPRQHAWPYLRGHAERIAGRSREMRAAFVRAAELAPEDVPSLVWAAESEADLENPEAARELVDRALRLDPDNTMALFRAGQLAAEQEDFERAERLLRRALELQPDADRMHLPLALVLRELGRLDEAQEHLERAGTRKPAIHDPLLAAVQREKTGATVLVNAGAQAFERGDLEQALALFARAVELDPESSSAHANFGAALLRAEREDEAHHHLKAAVELAPDDADARFNLATFYARHERDDLAVVRYREALEIDAEHEAAHFNLANALRRRGRCDEALSHYERVLERTPSNVEARLARAICLVALTRWEPALEALEELRRIAPGDARALNLQARVLACCPDERLRDPPKAVALATEAVRIQPWPEHARTLALAHHSAGNVEKALEWARGTVDAVERAGQEDAAIEFRLTLRQIEQGHRCVTP